MVQIQGLLKDPNEFLNLIVAQRGATPVRLSDVADVLDGPQEAVSLALVNSKPALAVDIVKVLQRQHPRGGRWRAQGDQ